MPAKEIFQVQPHARGTEQIRRARIEDYVYVAVFPCLTSRKGAEDSDGSKPEFLAMPLFEIPQLGQYGLTRYCFCQDSALRKLDEILYHRYRVKAQPPSRQGRQGEEGWGGETRRHGERLGARMSSSAPGLPNASYAPSVETGGCSGTKSAFADSRAAPASCQLTKTTVRSSSAMPSHSRATGSRRLHACAPTAEMGTIFGGQGRIRELGRTHKGCGYQPSRGDGSPSEQGRPQWKQMALNPEEKSLLQGERSPSQAEKPVGEGRRLAEKE